GAMAVQRLVADAEIDSDGLGRAAGEQAAQGFALARCQADSVRCLPGVGQQVAAEHDFSSSCPTSHCTDSTSPERLQIQIRSRSPAAIPGADGLEHAAEVIG